MTAIHPLLLVAHRIEQVNIAEAQAGDVDEDIAEAVAIADILGLLASPDITDEVEDALMSIAVTHAHNRRYRIWARQQLDDFQQQLDELPETTDD